MRDFSFLEGLGFRLCREIFIYTHIGLGLSIGFIQGLYISTYLYAYTYSERLGCF